MTKDSQDEQEMLLRCDGGTLSPEDWERQFLLCLDDHRYDRKEVFYALLGLYLRTGQLDKARQAHGKATELETDLEEKALSFLRFGTCMEREEDYPAAIDAYRHAHRLEPTDPSNWYFINNNLGFCLNQLGEYEAAEAYLQTAIKIDPHRPNALKNLGLSLQGRGRLFEAAEWFIANSRVHPQDPRSLTHLEQLLEEHPELLEEHPSLQRQLEACRRAVTKTRLPLEDDE